ncbi:hypothetical protein LTR96_011858, partial [Exophiala xenobiotica]
GVTTNHDRKKLVRKVGTDDFMAYWRDLSIFNPESLVKKTIKVKDTEHLAQRGTWYLTIGPWMFFAANYKLR